MSGTWDVVVIGAGVGGAVTAALAGRAGLKTLLVERCAWPREKVCGGCLSHAALQRLRSAGLLGAAARCGGAAVERFRLAVGGWRATIGIPPGLAICRAMLDAELVAAARIAGATFQPETRAAVLSDGRGAGLASVALLSARGETVRAGAVVVASGLGASGRPADWPAEHVWRASHFGLGAMLPHAGAPFEPGMIYMACAAGGYVGAVRPGGELLAIAAALSPRAVRAAGGPAAACGGILAEAGWPVSGLVDADFRGVPRLSRRATCAARGRVFLLGDAAGYVEPFTGEGMAWASASAARLATLLPDAVCGRADAAAAWRDWIEGELRAKQWICRGLTTALRSRLLARGLVAAMQVAPAAVQSAVARMHGAAQGGASARPA